MLTFQGQKYRNIFKWKESVANAEGKLSVKKPKSDVVKKVEKKA